MIHFVTTLTNDFTPALEGLLLSLRDNAGCDYRFTVVTHDAIDPGNASRLEQLAEIEWFRREDLGLLHNPEFFKERMFHNFQKPVIWNLPYDHNMVYIDADIICVDDVSEMQAWEPITAVREYFPEESVGHYNPSPIPIWNAGVFCFRPDRTFFNGLSKFYEQYQRVEYGEQRIVNDFINSRTPESVHYADYGFNWRAYRPGCTDRIRVVHFAHDRKPHKDDPETAAEQMTFELFYGVMARDPDVYETFRKKSKGYLAGGTHDRSEVIMNESRRWRRKKKRFHRRAP